MKHYAGQVFAWDVVNEGLDEKGEVKNSPWYNQPGIGLLDQGTAYIEQAFRCAREADPQSLLFYNEAEGEGLNGKSDAVYSMVKDFKRRSVPIDGVGLQLHISQLDFDTAAIAANIARLTALGLQVHITELGGSLPLDPSGLARDPDLLRQAEVYRGVVRACMQNPGCTAIQTWGFTDKYSWIGYHSHGARGAALPFDRPYRRSPLTTPCWKRSRHGIACREWERGARERRIARVRSRTARFLQRLLSPPQTRGATRRDRVTHRSHTDCPRSADN